MLLWPIINIFFVILVGYDSDVTKSIRKLRQKRWRTLSTMTSTVDLGRIPSISIPVNMKRPLSDSHSDTGLHTSVIKHNNIIQDNDNDDLNFSQLELWKSRLSATEQKIKEQAGYDTREDRRLSLPNFHCRGSASYDTDNTLT